MKFLEGDIDSESRDSQISRKRTSGRKSRGVVGKTSRDQFIANLAVKLLMKRFSRRPIKPNHFESHDRMASPLFTDFFLYYLFHYSVCSHSSSLIPSSFERWPLSYTLLITFGLH